MQDVASWRRRLVESQSGQGSREAPGPSVPGRVSIVPESGLECSGSDEEEMAPAWEERRVDFPEVSEQLLDPSNGH